MTIETNKELPQVASKPYPLPFKHHNFVKEAVKNLLEARLIERSMSFYAESIIIVHRTSEPGTSLAETKMLVIDFLELNKQIPKVQITQTNQRIA